MVTSRTENFISFRDMTLMTNLNEAELSRNLEKRFLDQTFHEYMTYVGSTLLVVNPFAGYMRFLNESVKKSYLGDAFREFPEMYDVDGTGTKIDKPPHNFAISAVAYRKLFLDGIKFGYPKNK